MSIRLKDTITGNLSGNSSTATTLATARTINGTSFNGSANITTANWGTARTLTIGNTGKSVNGSGNVSWSLSEIGAAPTSHNHTSLTGVTNIAFAAGSSDSASMGMTVSSDTTYFDFNLTDDTNTDMWRWRFGAWDSSTSSTKTFNAMTLTATSTTAAKLAVSGTVQASTFSGALSGNASTATKATQDSAGQQINTTYIKGLSVNGRTITYTKGDGTTGTITTQDTNTTYSTGTASALGLTKLYTGTGTATDGTMTQSAINTALNGKANSSHTHNYAGSSSAGGNANAAVKLATARTINGTNFDGSGNITTANWGTARNIYIASSDGSGASSAVSVNGSGNATLKLPATIKATLSGNASTATTSNYLASNSRMDYNWNGMNYFNIDGKAGNAAKANDTPTSAWWHVMRFNHANSSGYYTDLAIPFNATSLYYKRITSGAVQNNGWVKVLDSLNYNEYAPTKTGGGASGTWGISVSGNAATATKLQTARTINGTSFNGSANITTANWGTARTLTIGSTGKSVNGSGNVSWSWSEMQVPRAYSSSHNFGGNQNAITTAQFITMLTNLGAFSQVYWVSRGSWSYASNQYINDTGCGNIHLAGCVVEVIGTTTAYTIRVTTPTTTASGTTNAEFIYINNGNDYSPGWRRQYNTKNKPTPSEIGAAASSHTHNYAGSSSAGGNANAAVKLATARTINGTSFNGSANITTANWGTARTLTIGNTGKSVNGSGNVSWSLSEIGAAAASHTHAYAPTSTGSSISIHADSDSSSTGEYLLLKAGHNELKIASSAGGTTVTKGQDKLTFNGNVVYHAGKKPTPADIGAATSSSVGTLSSLKTSAKGNLVSAINEVFQSADSARSSLVSAIGSPLTSTDTLASIATKLQSKKQELGTAAAKVVSGVSSSTNLNTIVSTLNGYKPYVGKAHTLYVDFNGGKTVYIQPQTTNGSTTIKQGSVWMAMIKDVGAKRDYCLCTSASYGFPSKTKDANNAVSFEIDGNGRVMLYCNLYSSKTYRIMLCSINPTYSEIDETEDSSYYYVVKTLEEKDEEEGRKDEESNC